MREKIDKVYTNIQNLQIQPTKHNTMLMAECFLLLEELWRMVPEKPEEKTEEAGDGADE